MLALENFDRQKLLPRNWLHYISQKPAIKIYSDSQYIKGVMAKARKSIGTNFSSERKNQIVKNRLMSKPCKSMEFRSVFLDPNQHKTCLKHYEHIIRQIEN